MKSLAAIVGTVLLLAGNAGAGVILLDACEDTSYTQTVGEGESVVLKNATLASQGESALNITYNFIATASSWDKNGLITKTLPKAVDLSDMDALEFDINLPMANGGFIFIISLIDEKGYELSADILTLFTSPTTGFRTISVPLASMVKNEWKGGGLAVNMRKIKKISYNFPNQRAVASDSLSFVIDNVKVVNGLGLAKEIMLENFESYADKTALALDYDTTSGATNAEIDLVTDNPRSGKQALKLTGTFKDRWCGAAARHNFLMPIDLSKAKYIRFSAFGDTALKGYNPMVSIYLLDRSGNNLSGRIWGWGEEEGWSDFFLPFNKTPTSDPMMSCWVEDANDLGGKEGKCNLSDIIGFSLIVEPQNDVPKGYPLTASVLFDNIVVGTDMGTQMNIVLPH